ncbi:MAG: eL32 family ribosomal protein [Minisyncoccales bacterium]
MKKFLRRASDRYSKLGLRRKDKQKWRKPKGRDNKMREKKKGYPAVVSIGYGRDKNQRELVNGKKPVYIVKPEELEKLKKDEIAIIGRVGKKRRIEISEKAKEKNIDIQNINPKRFLNKNKTHESKKQNEKKLDKKSVEETKETKNQGDKK